MIWPFRRAETLGRRGERVAARRLRREGYRILGRNVVLGRYEVDIIAREGDTVAFVEVKTRRDTAWAEPEANVHPEKRRRIGAAARIYLSRHQEDGLYYRFDVVSIVLPERGRPKVTLFRDAFQL